MQLAEQVLVTTRLDVSGGMVPIFPAGLGADIGLGWAPGLGEEAWRPLFRFSGGFFFFGSSRDLGPGRDYQAVGFRLNLEAGLLRGVRLPTGLFRWGLVAGAQAIGLVNVEPCGPGDDCSDALLGGSLRAEAQWFF